jgi:hypothetical protein
MLALSRGTWSGSPTYRRQWTHNGVAIPGETGIAYTIGAAFIGEMIGATVIGSNAGGSTSASADEVRPVEAAAPMTRGRAKVPQPRRRFTGRAIRCARWRPRSRRRRAGG